MHVERDGLARGRAGTERVPADRRWHRGLSWWGCGRQEVMQRAGAGEGRRGCPRFLSRIRSRTQWPSPRSVGTWYNCTGWVGGHQAARPRAPPSGTHPCCCRGAADVGVPAVGGVSPTVKAGRVVLAPGAGRFRWMRRAEGRRLRGLRAAGTEQGPGSREVSRAGARRHLVGPARLQGGCAARLSARFLVPGTA